LSPNGLAAIRIPDLDRINLVWNWEFPDVPRGGCPKAS
jgi:hypothetical protein